MINIEEFIKQAMKKHDTVETNVYRAIKAEILKFKTAKNAPTYDEVAELNLLKKMVKSREESILMYSEAGRKDLVSQEESELVVLEKLIPAAPSLEEIENFLQDWMKNDLQKEFCENGQIPKKLMATAIKACKLQFPIANGKEISNVVKKYVI